MRIGIALSGGAARGLAHVGVLSVLTKAGIKIDCVAGTSAGAVIGAAYCTGMSMEQIESVAPYIGWRRLARLVKSDQGFVSLDKLERWLIMLFGDIDIDELDLPFAVVTMDASTGERVVLRKGRLARIVRASCSVPGFVTPVLVDGRHLVDGGVVDNLPVDAARDLGADFVIGVDVFEPNFQRSLGPIGPGLAAFEALIRNSGGGVGRADFLIAPSTAGLSLVRFSKHRELIALGQAAAEDQLPCLLDAIERADALVGV